MVSCNILTLWLVIIVLHYRGDTFRPALLRIGEIRSLLPPNVNILAMTATASIDLRIQIAKMLSTADYEDLA